jgi:hypothetical protein
MTAQELETKINAWQFLKQQLDSLKTKEIDLRKEIVAAAFPGPVAPGTKRHPLPNGFALKYEQALSYDLSKDIAAVEAVMDTFDETAIALLVKTKYELSVSNYKALTDAERARFNSVLTIKPASPTLTLEFPKGAK